jgi:hypothetical protein
VTGQLSLENTMIAANIVDSEEAIADLYRSVWGNSVIVKQGLNLIGDTNI